MAEMETSVTLAQLADVVRNRSARGRTLTAVAGPPGAGKSTLAEALVAVLNDAAPGDTALLPMDGFHFDDGVLEAKGSKARKGAPDTFDVAGLRHVLGRLRRNDETEVAVPLFDRDLEISRAGARIIPSSVRAVIVEGNYLLLDEAPWSDLLRLFDTTVMITVPESVLRERLTQRWVSYGLAPEAISAKVDGNDLPNARFVAARSTAAEFVLLPDAAGRR